MNKRLSSMFKDLSKGRAETQPSKFWEHLTKINAGELSKYGYKNFKRTLSRHYFSNTPFFLMNKQILFLITHLNPFLTFYSFAKSVIIPRHNCFSTIDSISCNFITYLLWFYTQKIDKERLLDLFEEPVVGNPPRIYHQGKLISQDIANSVLEFKSIFGENVDKNQIITIAELGAGSGRDAYVFINLLPKLKKYIIIDIPPALAISETYLTEIFPNKKIFKYRPFKKFKQIEDEFNKSEILFFLSSQIELLPDNFADLFINISSLHEMRIEQIKYYFREIERITKKTGYFYLKQWKDSHLPVDDVHIKQEDYPIAPNWKIIYIRQPKVQIKFFEALLRPMFPLKKHIIL